ncbi:MAG: hypothetical protein ACXWZB_08520 [Gaiellaceae bacterium]
MKTALILLAAAAVTVSPSSAVVGETITVTGSPSRTAVLEALSAPARRVPLGTTGVDGTLRVKVPDVPRGTYRIVVAGEREAPVLEVVALSQGPSALLFGFGLLFLLALVVAGIVVHRRWRDAIS